MSTLSKNLQNILISLLVVFIPTLIFAAPSPGKYDGCIIAADKHNDKIYILDPSKKNLNNGIVWSVSLDEVTGVKAGELPAIAGAEIKWVMGGEYILLVAKRIVLLRIADKKVVWYGKNGGGECHSVELLPDGNVVTANPGSKNLKIFSVEHGVNNKLPVDSIEHKGAHGVVWDAKRELLWGVGGSELRAYRYNFNKKKPKLDSIVHSYPIEATGHDLYPVPGKDQLYYTNKNTWIFDIKTGKSKQLISKGAKSVSQNGPDGEIIYTVAVGKNNADKYGINAAQTPFINSIDGAQREFTGAGFYKARWFIPCPFSYPEWNYDSDDPVAASKPLIGNDALIGHSVKTINNQLNVSYNGSFSMTLYGINGKKIRKLHGINQTSFNTMDLPKGMYIATLNGKTGMVHSKIRID